MAAPVDLRADITEPGVYDLPEAVYHADPVPGGSLSSSGARKLLPPSCPAKFRWHQDHPEHSDVLDYGKAAHRAVLGAGPEIVVLDHEDWRSKAARSDRDAAREAGKVPMLLPDAEVVTAMADALRAHPIAGRLFAVGTGKPEQSLFWSDRRTGITRRARLDWLPDPRPANNLGAGGRMILPDYKTCASAEPSEIERAIHRYGYHQQGDWYLDGIYALGLAASAAFVLVCQEKTAPYVVTVVQIHPDTLKAGEVLNDYAIDVYRRCVATGHWPGYSDDVVLGRLPGWAEAQFERARERGDYEIKETVR